MLMYTYTCSSRYLPVATEAPAIASTALRTSLRYSSRPSDELIGDSTLCSVEVIDLLRGVDMSRMCASSGAMKK
jgi:hypothetical protein